MDGCIQQRKEIKPWLIQRGKFREEPIKNKNGLYSIISLDLMTSGEFYDEYLNNSLNRMITNFSSYEMLETSIRDKRNTPMYIFYNKEIIDRRCILDSIELLKNDCNLKEWCGLNSYLNGTSSFSRNDFWWDIRNDYFVFFGNKDLILNTMHEMDIDKRLESMIKNDKSNFIKKLIRHR